MLQETMRQKTAQYVKEQVSQKVTILTLVVPDAATADSATATEQLWWRSHQNRALNAKALAKIKKNFTLKDVGVVFVAELVGRIAGKTNRPSAFLLLQERNDGQRQLLIGSTPNTDNTILPAGGKFATRVAIASYFGIPFVHIGFEEKKAQRGFRHRLCNQPYIVAEAVNR